MTDSTVTVKVVPEIDEEALLAAVLKVIAGNAVVKPGEMLVIRSANWTPDQAEMYQEDLNRRDLPFWVLVVIGDELAVAKPESHAVVDVNVTGSAVMTDADAGNLAKAIDRNLRRWRGDDPPALASA